MIKKILIEAIIYFVELLQIVLIFISIIALYITAWIAGNKLGLPIGNFIKKIRNIKDENNN